MGLHALSTMARFRLLWVFPVLAACLALCGASSAKSSPPKSSPGFTLKRAYVQVEAGRLVYTVTVCTTGQAKLSVTSSFTPLKHGVPVARPGATQYQSAGCWPAVVAASIVRHAPACKPLACPVVAGKRYRITVRITNPGNRKFKRAPALTRKA